MKRLVMYSLLAAAGFISAFSVAMAGNKNPLPAPPVAAPAQSPFEISIAGSGVVESASENIAVGSHLSGIVDEVYVRPGVQVKKGEPLFKLDSRKAISDFVSAESQAKLQAAQSREAELQWERSQTLKRGSLSLDERESRKFKAASAAAQWEAARAEADAARTFVDLHTVKAPIDGEILSVKIRPGEFAVAGKLAEPLIIMGDTSKKFIRVDIDENDAWRVKTEARAIAYIRGNRSMSASLRFIRTEPYVIPKRSLTGGSTERTDTRVLQLIFEVQDSGFPAYIGQLVDVFIEGSPII